MRVNLSYGRDGLEFEVPDTAVVVTPRQTQAVSDPVAAVKRAIRSPLAGPDLTKLVRKGQSVAIAVCDGTRPQPRTVVIPVLLEELSALVDLDDIVILVATGTHRGNTLEELDEMLGAEVLRTVRVVNHDARDEASLAFFGTCGDGVPVYLNKEWLHADLRITTGFIEPHLFAGFSGGPKLVAPGLAGLATTLVLHDARRIGDRRATWAVTEGNPVHDDIRSIAAATGVDFACDVVLNSNQEIAGVFAGELFAIHAAGCELARRVAMQPVDSCFDVVITTNAGFPLDQNLYQSVKGQSAAVSIVRPGGLILAACECSDGFPDYGSYRELITGFDSPRALLDAIRTSETTWPDQWVLQLQARIQEAARVAIHADGLSDADLLSAHFEPVGDVSAFVHEELERVGPDATCCVLPEGPLTIPYLATENKN
jgi:nickel-dependent lactate racemase